MGLRLIPRIDESPTLVRLGKTRWGRLGLVGVFSFLLWLSGRGHLLATAIPLAAISILPNQRRAITALASLGCALAFLPSSWTLPRAVVVFGRPLQLPLGALVLLAFYLLSSLLLRWARRNPDHWLLQRPVRNFLVFYTLLLIATPHLSQASAWGQMLLLFIVILGKYLWFLLYSLVDRRRLRTQTPAAQVARYHPFWGSTHVPFPKGEAYLGKIEAKNDGEFAVCQLKGIKLLLWALVLTLAQRLYLEFVHGIPAGRGWWLPYHATIPDLRQAMALYHRGYPIERALCWFSVFSNYAENVFSIAIMGHFIVAACRMAGYRVLRNTYKPCLARTVADFYNRIYYYFKELLVDMFFYPTYFRYFTKHTRFRMFFATMAAAFFGNSLYHFLRDFRFIVAMGFWRALYGIHVYLIYSLILGAAIGLSQLRSLSRPRPRSFLLPILTTGTFYSFIMILDDPNRGWSIRDCGFFILNLFVTVHP